MLLDLLSGGFDRDTLISFLLFLPVMLISLPLHELAHGYAAYKMGDNTARNFGRLTLNPLKHLDLFGTLSMLVLGFGWAKPVPVNSRNFRKPRQGMAWTAVAGPAANLILCFLALSVEYFLIWLFNQIGFTSDKAFYAAYALVEFFDLLSYYNAALCIFNLIPIPPLDGSRIVTLILPPKAYYTLMRYERYFMYGFMALVLILSYGFRISIISYPTQLLYGLFSRILSLIFRF